MQDEARHFLRPEPPLETPRDPVRWSPRRWAATLAAVFALQIALIHFLERPLVIRPQRPQFGTRIVVAATPAAQQRLAEIQDLQDPTLFALPNPKGFSGEAWLRFQSPDHVFPNWDEPRRWLPLDTRELGAPLSRFVSTNAPRQSSATRRPPERFTGIEVYVPSKTVEKPSELSITGDLARRPLLTPSKLPAWPHPDVLPESVVRLFVDDEGYVLSTTPLTESGLQAADQFALEFARAARFERRSPTTPAGLNWGRMVFKWRTVPSNNVPPQASASP